MCTSNNSFRCQRNFGWIFHAAEKEGDDVLLKLCLVGIIVGKKVMQKNYSGCKYAHCVCVPGCFWRPNCNIFHFVQLLIDTEHIHTPAQAGSLCLLHKITNTLCASTEVLRGPANSVCLLSLLPLPSLLSPSKFLFSSNKVIGACGRALRRV